MLCTRAGLQKEFCYGIMALGSGAGGPGGCHWTHVQRFASLRSASLHKGQQPRTAAPNAAISPCEIPFDKILPETAHSSLTLLAHNFG